MENSLFPAEIPNWIDGEQRPGAAGELFDKLAPHHGRVICRVARSRAADVESAIAAASKAQPAWAETPPVQRGTILHDVCNLLHDRREDVARVVALETGKSFKDALGETGGGHRVRPFLRG